VVDQKIQEAELEYLYSSAAAETALAENYVGLPYLRESGDIQKRSAAIFPTLMVRNRKLVAMARSKCANLAFFTTKHKTLFANFFLKLIEVSRDRAGSS
jgi:hypothetical protein